MRMPLWQQLLFIFAPPLILCAVFLWWKVVRKAATRDSTKPLRTNRKRRRRR